MQAGRVLVGEEHGVRALDVVTGEEAWHYTRSNARLCDVTAVDGRAVAVFATAGRCDEAVALDAGTGVRQWTRNLSLRPDISLTSSPGMVLATAPTGRGRARPGQRHRCAGGPPPPRAAGSTDRRRGGAAVVLLESCDGTTRLRGLERGAGDRDVDPRRPGARRLARRSARRRRPAGRLAVGDDLQLFRGRRTATPLPAVPLPAGRTPTTPPPRAGRDRRAPSSSGRAAPPSRSTRPSGGCCGRVPSAGLPAVRPEKALDVVSAAGPRARGRAPSSPATPAPAPRRGRSTVDGDVPRRRPDGRRPGRWSSTGWTTACSPAS